MTTEFAVTPSPIVARRGQSIDLGVGLVGQNLNLIVIRGHAPLDVLADISAPDIYDQEENPTGTQRDLKPKHAEDCFAYAVDAIDLLPEDDPRAFPEIILNVRDTSVVEFYDLDDDSNLYDITSTMGLDEVEARLVGIRVRTSRLEWPKPKRAPQVSRVDGNHRLAKADELVANGDGDNEIEYPQVPFTLLVGLEVIQEARLFRDINGEHEGMETAHLDTIVYRIRDHEEMKSDPKLLPLWLAHELRRDDRAFAGMVFLGGSKAGVKKTSGAVPPVKINSLKTTIASQLRAAPGVMAALRNEPEKLLELLDRFWKAVRESFPEAWQDKRNYILLQAIGLGAFARFGGLLLDRAWDNGQIKLEDFKAALTPVAKKVSLRRTDYPGIAGAGGQQYIAELLIEAAEPDEVIKAKNLQELGGPPEDKISLS